MYQTLKRLWCSLIRIVLGMSRARTTICRRRPSTTLTFSIPLRATTTRRRGPRLGMTPMFVCLHTHTHYYYYYKESRAKARYDVNAATFANACM